MKTILRDIEAELQKRFDELQNKKSPLSYPDNADKDREEVLLASEQKGLLFAMRLIRKYQS